jgi:hypothetical protein
MKGSDVMEVYVVLLFDDFSDEWIVNGVCSTLEKAKEWANKLEKNSTKIDIDKHIVDQWVK